MNSWNTSWTICSISSSPRASCNGQAKPITFQSRTCNLTFELPCLTQTYHIHVWAHTLSVGEMRYSQGWKNHSINLGHSSTCSPNPSATMSPTPALDIMQYQIILLLVAWFFRYKTLPGTWRRRKSLKQMNVLSIALCSPVHISRFPWWWLVVVLHVVTSSVNDYYCEINIQLFWCSLLGCVGPWQSLVPSVAWAWLAVNGLGCHQLYQRQASKGLATKDLICRMFFSDDMNRRLLPALLPQTSIKFELHVVHV